MRDTARAKATAAANGKPTNENGTITRAPERKNSKESPSTRCFDWMIVGGSTSYARDREVFTTYRPFKNMVIIGGGCVVGIGTVHLIVLPTQNDSRTYNLTLKDVCHIPDAICNGFMPSVVETGKYHYCDEGYLQGLDAGSQPIWHATPFCASYRLVLAGNHKGDSPIADLYQKNVPFNLSMYTSKKERNDIRANLEEERKEKSDETPDALIAQLELNDLGHVLENTTSK